LPLARFTAPGEAVTFGGSSPSPHPTNVIRAAKMVASKLHDTEPDPRLAIHRDLSRKPALRPASTANQRAALCVEDVTFTEVPAGSGARPPRFRSRGSGHS
jgi:hypothetical protein